YRGSGRRWVLLAVNLRAMKVSPAGEYEKVQCRIRFRIARSGEPCQGDHERSLLLGGCGRFLALGAVLRAGLFPLGDSLAIEHAPNNVVANAGKITHAAAADQDDRVFLEIVSFTANVGRDLLAVGQPNPRHLPQSG